MSKTDRRELGEKLPGLVDRLVESYTADVRTQRIDRRYLPSRRSIIDICDVLMELTYPGYFGRRSLSRHNIAYHAGELLPKLFDLLWREIEQSLCHEVEQDRPEACPETARCHDESCRKALAFLERMPEVRARLAEDVQAAYDGDPAATGTPEVILAYPALIAITIFRYAHELHALGVPLVPRIMTEHAHQLTGIDIHPGADIGHRFFIDHGTGVVIGETTVIGDRVKIYQGVTLGALSFPRNERGEIIRGEKRHPTVGHDVTIYANATVLGGNTVIGDGAVIGGSVFLTHSVEPGHRVSITPPVLRFKPRREKAKST